MPESPVSVDFDGHGVSLWEFTDGFLVCAIMPPCCTFWFFPPWCRLRRRSLASMCMALRLQRERQNAGFLPSLREYIRRWQVTDSRLERAKPGVVVMHPGPMNEGIEISNDIAHGGNSVIEDQVTNGVAVRMALLYKLTIGPGQEA